MKFLFAIVLLVSSMAYGSIGDFKGPINKRFLNCELSVMDLDRVLEVRGVCPYNTDPSFVVGYYVGLNNYKAYEVKRSLKHDKHKNNIFEYRIFIKPRLVLQK